MGGQAQDFLVDVEGGHVAQAHGEHGALEDVARGDPGGLAHGPQVVLPRGQQALVGDQAHDLTAGHHQAAFRGQAPGRLEDGVGGSLLVVREVDADLGPTIGVHVPADGFAMAEEAPATDLFAHGLGGVHVIEAHEGRQVVAVGLGAVVHGLLEAAAGEVAVTAGERALGVEDQFPCLVVGFHAAPPGHAALLPQLEGDVRGMGLIRGVQRDVVGHQEFPGADDGGAGPGVVAGREVWLPLGILELPFQSLVLAPANLGEVAALGPGGSGFVEIHRNGQLPGHTVPQAAGQLGAVLHAHPFHGHEGHHVRGPHARMGAVLLAHVDDLGGFRDAGKGPGQHRLGLAHEGDHRAVGVSPRIHVQDFDTGHGGDGVPHLLDLRGIPAFRDVWHTLHQLPRHRSSVGFNLNIGAAPLTKAGLKAGRLS